MPIKRVFEGRKWVEQGSHKQKKGLFQTRSATIEGVPGVHQADDLTSVDHEIPDPLV